MEKLLTLNLTTQQTLRIMFGVGEIYMLSFRYDRLMSFCNKCGMLTHDVKECLLHTDEDACKCKLRDVLCGDMWNITSLY